MASTCRHCELLLGHCAASSRTGAGCGGGRDDMFKSVLQLKFQISAAAQATDFGKIAKDGLHPLVVLHLVDIAGLLLLGVDSRDEKVCLDLG